MKRSFVFALILLFTASLFSQNNLPYSHQLQLIDSLRAFIIHDLKLNIDSNFYNHWTKRTDSMYVFLYVSEGSRIKMPDSIKPVWFFANRSDAVAKSNELKSNGYETLIYQTAGMSNTELNRKLVSYPDEALAFIVFHEATHQHIGMGIEYDYVESTCDAVANRACILFAEKTKMLNLKSVKKQKRIFETAYAYLNDKRKVIDSTAGDKKNIFKSCNRKIQWLIKNANQFQKDRMGYEVNNAYFVRVEPYALRYFKVKELLGEKLNTGNVLAFAPRNKN